MTVLAKLERLFVPFAFGALWLIYVAIGNKKGPKSADRSFGLFAAIYVLLLIFLVCLVFVKESDVGQDPSLVKEGGSCD